MADQSNGHPLGCRLPVEVEYQEQHYTIAMNDHGASFSLPIQASVRLSVSMSVISAEP
jgi:hypothetical protein